MGTRYDTGRFHEEEDHSGPTIIPGSEIPGEDRGTGIRCCATKCLSFRSFKSSILRVSFTLAKVLLFEDAADEVTHVLNRTIGRRGGPFVDSVIGTTLQFNVQG